MRSGSLFRLLTQSRHTRRLRSGVSTERRHQALAAAFEATSLNLPAAPRVAVVEKCGFLLNRIHKNGNSSLVTLAHWLETGRLQSPMRARRAIPNLSDWPIAGIESLGSWPKLVVVRNPYSRVLSAFLDKVRTKRFQNQCGRLESSPEGFRQFVRWLAEGGLAVNPHWDLQQKQMFFPIETYTDVLRLERLNADLSVFLERIGVEPGVMFQSGAFDRGQTHRTDANSKLGLYYDSESIERVRQLFESDFELLRYDPNGAPSVI